MSPSNHRSGKIGLGTIFLAILLGCGAVALLSRPEQEKGSAQVAVPVAARGTVVTSKPPAARGPAVGDVGHLRLDGATGVWIALDESAWDAMIDAENQGARGGPGAGGPIYRLAQAGKVRKFPVGTRVRVVKTGVFSRLVEVLDGDERGTQGWVQMEFVGP